MIFNDLREFIRKAEELGKYKLVEGADWFLEIGTLSELFAKVPDSPVLMFDKIKGYPAGYRVVTNLFHTERQRALGLGLPADKRGIELVKAMRNKINQGIKLLPPVEVKNALVKENILTGDEVDLYKFPVPKFHELDGGRYIGSGCAVITRF